MVPFCQSQLFIDSFVCCLLRFVLFSILCYIYLYLFSGMIPCLFFIKYIIIITVYSSWKFHLLKTSVAAIS